MVSQSKHQSQRFQRQGDQWRHDCHQFDCWRQQEPAQSCDQHRRGLQRAPRGTRLKEVSSYSTISTAAADQDLFVPMWWVNSYPINLHHYHLCELRRLSCPSRHRARFGLRLHFGRLEVCNRRRGAVFSLASCVYIVWFSPQHWSCSLVGWSALWGG